jgi:NAD+ synthetase
MRILLAQRNTVVGDVVGNTQLAINAIARGRELGADLVVLPEQTIPGYPAKDLLLQRDFIARCHDALEKIARATAEGPAVLVGFPELHRGIGAGLYNSAALCWDGLVENVYRKRLLPTYDVFDEDRYFDPGTDLCIPSIKGIRVGITICEDIWNDELYWAHRRYPEDPVAETVAAGAEVVINLSASPFTLSKVGVRDAMLAEVARRHGVPVLMTNLVGANDDVIFDGHSPVADADGRIIARGAGFVEEDVVVELRRDETGRLRAYIAEGGNELDAPVEMEQLRRALVLGIRDYMAKCGFRRALIGLSGGIDSALVAALATEAVGPGNVEGVAMPSRYSSDHSVADAEALAANLKIGFRKIPIESMFQAGEATLATHLEVAGSRLAYENMQARLRGVILMTLSNASGALVLTTGNKSELSVGYCTLYGDMCGGLAAIADVPKTMVYRLARHINLTAGAELIPRHTIEKPPSAELAPNQFDTDSLPPYPELDPLLSAHIEQGLGESELVERGFPRDVVQRILRLVALSEYKRRQAAPALKVTSRAFGIGWRMPIAKRIT